MSFDLLPSQLSRPSLKQILPFQLLIFVFFLAFTVKPAHLRTRHSYGQFVLSLGKENRYIFSSFNPLNTGTFYDPLSVCINGPGFDFTWL